MELVKLLQYIVLIDVPTGTYTPMVRIRRDNDITITFRHPQYQENVTNN